MPLQDGVQKIIERHKKSNKPLAIILAGHNGSGKSTLWYRHLVDMFQIPLVNADRMMLSILPEVTDPKGLPSWAISVRDKNTEWMQVAQKGVESFVAQAVGRKVPFAQEWDEALVWLDTRYEYDESRMAGLIPEGDTLYYAAFVDRGDVRHIISLRYAERKEIKHYVENYR